jgi:hypothetical protein
MDLTQEQKQSVKKWVESGDGLSDVQKKLREQFGLSLTYMDVRFLVLDLGLAIKDRGGRSAPKELPGSKKSPPGKAPVVKDKEDDEAWADDEPMDEAELTGPANGGAPSGVSVDLDRITKPGSVMSGTVKFSDGVSASWFLDQFGRLGLQASKPGYKPSASDLREFQVALQTKLGARGY